MSKRRLVFNYNDDESFSVWLDGQYVISVNHDEHGWDGMIGVRAALENVAKIRGWTVVEDGEVIV